MATSRRVFLQGTMAGVAGVLGKLRSMATPQSGRAATEGSQIAARRHVRTAPTEYTRGIGIYPGNPREDFGPILVPGGATYRNLALHRPAYHSSCYDYNLTAQLVTDGIKETRPPEWVATSVSFRGLLPKQEREFILDHNDTTTVDLRGPRPWVQVQLGGGASVPEVDRVVVLLLAPLSVRTENLSVAVLASSDGREWKELGRVTNPQPPAVTGYPPGFGQGAHLLHAAISLKQTIRSRFYRIVFEAAHTPEFSVFTEWQVAEVAFFAKDERIEFGGPYHFTSAWMSGGLGEEWVHVDLGAPSEFDRVVLYWIARAAEGTLQVSDDAQNWRDLEPLPASASNTDDLRLAQPAQGRYVRVWMRRPTSPDGYILSEMEVYGRGGLVAQPKPGAAVWRLERHSLVSADGAAISQPGFRDQDWLAATVPGTVLTSYLNAGAIPNPDFGDNQLQISDSFFYADFWYRNEFTPPDLAAGQRAWLNFDGINWKADVFLNGEKLGRIEGGFIRGRFDVTERLRRGAVNALALRVEKNETPGSVKQKTFQTTGKNGGALGLDNPTYHASIGWDWISTIRGRNTGIWNDVYLTVSGPVTLENPFVTTALPLPDTSRADVSIEVELANHIGDAVSGTLRGRLGSVEFEQQVRIEGSATQRVKLDPSNIPALRLQNPKLWWPAGYGEPNLYEVSLRFETADKQVSDAKTFQVGVRQMAYSEDGGALKIWINGRRFVARGGNRDSANPCCVIAGASTTRPCAITRK